MKKISNLFMQAFCGLILLSACGAPASATSIRQSELKREEHPQVAEADLQTLVGENNAFGLNLYQALHADTGNLILSPYSISLALAMTYAGARGVTETQMAQTLQFTQSQAQVHAAFNALDLSLKAQPAQVAEDQKPFQLSIANGLWIEQTYQFLPQYLDTLALNYGAGIRAADFAQNFDQERLGINQWVSDQTEDRINNLLADGSLNADTKMVLVNAIYFKADWLSQFDADATYDAPFHLLDGSEVSVPTMNDSFYGNPYLQGADYQVLELRYAGETTAMDIFLPAEGNFEAFESAFSAERYAEMIGALKPADAVRVSLPKFQFAKDFNLSAALSKLGMSVAFDPQTADFSGMTGKPDLFISDVAHKAFVAVDEDGTEAAAATAVIMGATSAMPPETVFTADRPFIFVIRNTVNGQILFIGRVLNPAQ
ncbi:MAG: serpin family protein [Anaerolineales bacterium]|nr:serpin family protein [Anaerolineales bacterium]MCZ2122418.1 serpin family protein [Anaerolineales bacterium]